MPETPKPATNAAEIEHWNAVAGKPGRSFASCSTARSKPRDLRPSMRWCRPRVSRFSTFSCGRGHTSLALADRLGSTGSVVGVDISAPMLEVALHRSCANPSLAVTFRQVDTQTDDLGRGLFDAAFSRFGVMFFSDPETAFANIRKTLKPGGRLAFICWRSLAENRRSTNCRARFRPM